MNCLLGAGPVSACIVACVAIFGSATNAQAQVRLTAPVIPMTSTITPARPTAYATAMAVPVTASLAKPVYGPTIAPISTVATPSSPTSVLTPTVLPSTAILDLASLVAANRGGDVLDEESNCVATAVYFEARGESLDGQLAVAQVVMNRAASGRYPTSWCAVVKQKAQFSFVRRGGLFPSVNVNCEQWVRAQAIARIATKQMMAGLPQDVLWYHANYVAPSWKRRLSRVSQIGAHIFYRA